MANLRFAPPTIKPGTLTFFKTQKEKDDYLQEVITELNKEFTDTFIPHIRKSFQNNALASIQADQLYEVNNPTKTFYKYASTITSIYEDENQQTFITTAAGDTILRKY